MLSMQTFFTLNKQYVSILFTLVVIILSNFFPFIECLFAVTAVGQLQAMVAKNQYAEAGQVIKGSKFLEFISFAVVGGREPTHKFFC